MSCTARHGIAQPFPHRWCPLVARIAVAGGMIPALFGGGTGATVFALAVFAAVGLLMTVGYLRAPQGAPKQRMSSARAAVALTSDILMWLIAVGLVIGAQLGGGSGAVLFSSGGVITMTSFLALCAVQHFAHRHTRRRSRRY
ncbi:hypothetical protein AB0393_27920 [Streptomyces cyaneofuscatus]|uniref:hypothetical protein n=1 Tax=Streptomyces cyaneofuscatus TaxID=66883 RepID=UPI00344B21D1